MRLRKLRIEDAPRMLEWIKTESINRFFSFDAEQMTLRSAENFIQKAEKESKNIHCAIVNEYDIYMGTVSLKNIDSENKKAEYAISLHPDAIGKNYATFATKEILKIAFNNFQLNRVYLNVLSENKRAIKFYDKFGFHFEGEFEQHLIIRNETKNLRWYRMLKYEFTKNGRGGGVTV